MKKCFIVLLVVAMLCLAGCTKKEPENTPASQTPTQTEVAKVLTDAEKLEDLKKKITVVENRKEYNDESGDLLYYLQEDYLVTDVDDPIIQKIVSNYPKTDIEELNADIQTMFQDVGIQRMYPDDVYYSTRTYSVFGVHNDILTIGVAKDWWWGSPHPWPSSSFESYDLKTGEVYDFPADVKDEIYAKAVDEFMSLAKEQNYMGLMGSYYDLEGNAYRYLEYENEQYTLTDENVLRMAVDKALHDGDFYFEDQNICFSFDASVSLSDWASRILYSGIVIPNEWNI